MINSNTLVVSVLETLRKKEEEKLNKLKDIWRKKFYTTESEKNELEQKIVMIGMNLDRLKIEIMTLKK